jgi:hypothetical protein
MYIIFQIELVARKFEKKTYDQLQLYNYISYYLLQISMYKPRLVRNFVILKLNIRISFTNISEETEEEYKNKKSQNILIRRTISLFLFQSANLFHHLLQPFRETSSV